ncbi:Putative LOC100167353, partial [Caligus rogercresseyi]
LVTVHSEERDSELSCHIMWAHFSLILLSSVVLVSSEADPKILEEHIESIQVDESVYAPGVRDIHRYVKEYRELNKHTIPPEGQILDLLHTIDFTKSGNNKFSKLGVLLDKFHGLAKNGVPFEDIRKAIPNGAELSQALIGVHNLNFEQRDQLKKSGKKTKTAPPKKKKKDPNVAMMELMGYPGFAVSKGVELATGLGFISKPTSKAITENLVPILQSEAAGEYVNSFYNMTMAFFRSPSGERLILGLPDILKDPTPERGLKFLKKEIEWNTELFFDSMENSDYKDNVLKIISSYVSKGITQGERLLGAPSEKGLLLLNGLFLSQGLPAYDHNRPIYSLGMGINKGIKLFTTFRFDVSPYIDSLEEMFKDIKESGSWKLFFSLDEGQRLTAVQRFIDDELSEPIGDLWFMHSSMSKGGTWACAPRYVCLETQRAKKRGKEAQQVGTSVLSMALAWIWNEGGGEFWNVYEAVWSGVSLECDAKYPPKDFKDCDPLPWQNEGAPKNKMELNFDKIEL